MPKKVPADVARQAILMDAKGQPQEEIAVLLGIRRETVCHICQRHYERVYAALTKSHVAERARQFKLLGWMWREAREEWLRSKKDQTRRKATRNISAKHSKKGKAVRLEIETRDGLGDPAFLDRMNAILGAMRVVLMLEEPPKRGKRTTPAAGSDTAGFDVEAALKLVAEMTRETGAGAGPPEEGEVA
jgi:hypothetical protein